MSPRSDPTDETSSLTPGQESTAAGAHALVAGRYRLLAMLGSGGMGSVYKALDEELDEIVALKVLRKDLLATERIVERFRREVKLARRVTHPNVARTFDIGEHDGEKFLTMEYVEGESLSSQLATEGRLAAARATAIALDICAGLAAAHVAGVIHRDLKPDNVLLEKGGRVVITDFGIACARGDDSPDAQTQGGTVGTPAYMAPEQVRGSRSLDARTDLYALGVLLFELLSGRLPFEGETAYTLATARLVAAAPDLSRFVPNVPAGLARIVAQCLEREPDARPPSAQAVCAALTSVAPTMVDEPTISLSLAPRPSPPAETKPGDKSVAVLPFRNAGPTEDDDLVDGLTEDLIDTLSMVPKLRVRPRTVVMRYRDRELDPRDLGRELGVDVVVDASLRRIADKVRVTVRLLGVDSGFQLWAKRFDRSASELLVVSDEAAESIATALAVHGSGARRTSVTDPEAIELYLQGRACFHRLWEGAALKAVDILASAHERAPDDPTILSAYARARAQVWFQEGGTELGRGAKELAARALDAAPERGESWLAVAAVRYVALDVAAAATHVTEALRLSPQLADAHDLLADLMAESGELEESLRRHQVAVSLDPRLRSRHAIARSNALLGRWEVVDSVLRELPDEDWNSVARGALEARLALWHPDARARMERVRAQSGTAPALQYGMIVRDVITNGELSAVSRAIVQEQFVRADDAPRFSALKHQLAAELFAYVGDAAAVLEHVRAAAAVGLADSNWIEYCPVLAPLREAPGFQEARARIKERARAAWPPLSPARAAVSAG